MNTRDQCHRLDASGLIARYAALVGRHPWIVIGLVALLLAAMTFGTSLLTFRSDERVFFSADNPQLAQLEAFEARYGRDDNGILILRTKSGDIFTAERLSAIAELVERLWHTPFVKRVDAPTNFQIAAGDTEGIHIDHTWRLDDPTGPEDLTRTRARALGEPMLRGRLLSPDGATALVVVSLRMPAEGREGGPAKVLQFLRAEAALFREAYPDFTVGVSGSAALDETFGEASARDGALLTPLMFLLMLALLGVLLWSLPAVIGALLVIAGAIGSGLGAGGWLGIPLTSVSVAAPYIITIIALADTVHLAFAAARERRHGTERVEAVCTALQQTAWPIFLTSATTAAGFFSLIFSDAPPFAHLGILSGLGALFAWLLSMTLAPALLILIPWRAPRTLASVSLAFAALGRFITRSPWIVALLSLSIATVLATFVTSNELDDRYVQYFDERFDFRRDTDLLNKHLGGFYTLDFDLRADGPGGVSDPDYLSSVEAFASWMRKQPGVTHVTSHADRIRMLNQAFNDGDPSRYALPNERAVAAQFLALYEMQLPHGLDLKEQLSADKSASRMTVALGDLSTGETLALADRAAAWIESNAPQLLDSRNATGTTLMFSHIGMRNIQEMVLGTIVAFIVIGGLLFLAFRCLATTAVAMVANIAPILIALGGWGLLVGQVGMAVATIAAVTLGIVVDDTIHLIAGVRKALAQGSTADEAIQRGLVEAGPGIAATTICLAAGFFCLSLSGFQINAWIGLMSAIVALVAFAFDLLFLPAAMLLIARRHA